MNQCRTGIIYNHIIAYFKTSMMKKYLICEHKLPLWAISVKTYSEKVVSSSRREFFRSKWLIYFLIIAKKVTAINLQVTQDIGERSTKSECLPSVNVEGQFFLSTTHAQCRCHGCILQPRPQMHYTPGTDAASASLGHLALFLG